MSLPYVHSALINQMIVIISQSFNQVFSNDEQAVIGAFLTTLGDMISFNSTYCSYLLNSQENPSNDYDLLEKSIDKIKEELTQLKKEDL